MQIAQDPSERFPIGPTTPKYNYEEIIRTLEQVCAGVCINCCMAVGCISITVAWASVANEIP